MSQVTQKELESLQTLIGIEASLYEKFNHYASSCSEEHVTKLCRQLADRSRQHLTALVDAVENSQTQLQ